MDVLKRETQICIRDGAGTVVHERRIRTERGRFADVLGTQARARIVVEGSAAVC